MVVVYHSLTHYLRYLVGLWVNNHGTVWRVNFSNFNYNFCSSNSLASCFHCRLAIRGQLQLKNLPFPCWYSFFATWIDPLPSLMFFQPILLMASLLHLFILEECHISSNNQYYIHTALLSYILAISPICTPPSSCTQPLLYTFSLLSLLILSYLVRTHTLLK